MISFNSISILLLGLGLNLKSYMDFLLIWGSIYPQNIILPTIFRSLKVLKKKNDKENNFFTFGFVIENRKKNIIKFLKKNVYILKLFNIHIMGENKWNKFKDDIKIISWLLMYFFIFLSFSLLFTFRLYLLFLTYFFKFFGNQT